MTQAHEKSIVRILSDANFAMGSGFLITSDHVLTCAHVVAAALGDPVQAKMPQEKLLLDFPLLAPDHRCTAKAIYWDPALDVAVLEIVDAIPEGVQAAPLVQNPDLWQHPFRAFGFPSGFENGVWASGRILAREATGWLQIEDSKETGYFVQPGFSGGAIWDESLGGVVALVVAADTNPGVRAAFALPVTRALAKWRESGQVQIDIPEKNPVAQHLRTYFPTQDQGSGALPASEKNAKRKRIFLSYKRDAKPDEVLALALYQALSKEHDVFIDQLMPVGTAWRARIQDELERCDFLIPLLSTASAHSEMVEYEISSAHQLARRQAGKPGILPVRVAYTAPFEYPLSAYLNPLNWSFWRDEQDTPALVAELNTAISGGNLSLSDLKGKEALLQAQQAEAVPRPRASADIGQIERPDGTMDLESRFYIERPGDAVTQREIGRGSATIVIKAPRQMGKSSLLVRAAAQSHKLGREVVFLDFQLLDEAMLNDPQRFFQNFCRWVADELDIDAPVEPIWEGGLGHVQSTNKYIRRHALRRFEKPITLVMDEVDRMLDCPFRSDFFGMLRSWHNNRATGPEWRKLDLVLVISTEPYLLIEDLKQSPFNVGEVIRLEDFDLAQTAELNDRHGSPFSPPQVERLYQLLGGHPYLTRQALYRVTVGEIDPEELLTGAANEKGPFGDHLRRHLTRFGENPALANAMLAILRQQSCEDELLYNRLHGAGLVIRVGERTLPRCELYANYFGEKLNRD
jgi:hypothetical protein